MKQILHSMKLFLPRMAFGGRFSSLDRKQGSAARKEHGGEGAGRKTPPKVSPCSKNIFGWIKY